ncbi:MAG: hypothetical protein AB8B95_03770 [Pseudohongiellaceae bacterium]
MKDSAAKEPASIESLTDNIAEFSAADDCAKVINESWSEAARIKGQHQRPSLLSRLFKLVY